MPAKKEFRYEVVHFFFSSPHTRRVHEDIINKGKGRGFLPALKSSVKAIGFGIGQYNSKL